MATDVRSNKLAQLEKFAVNQNDTDCRNRAKGMEHGFTRQMAVVDQEK